MKTKFTKNSFKTSNTLLSALKDSTDTPDVSTANGMAAFSSTDEKVLDFFFLSGASRNIAESDIINIFRKALAENTNLALKALFYAGDVREGQGERRLFRILTKELYENNYDLFKGLIKFIPEYTRWDNLIYLLRKPGNLSSKKISKNNIELEWKDTEIFSEIMKALKNGNGICAKWMPRKGSFFNLLASEMKMPYGKLRKLLVKLTKEANTVEQLMCSGNWDKINYSTVSSKAFNIYKKAFYRRDSERFEKFINKAVNGTAKINTSVLYPVDIVGKYISSYNAVSGIEKKAAIAQWNQLPDFIGRKSKDENYLVVADVSGSMSGKPMEVSISLAMYLSERNSGIFKDAFLTFSSNPALNILKGDLFKRINQLKRADFGRSTDLEKTFKLILEKAVSNKVPVSGMPSTIIIVSDMEFNQANGRNSNAAAFEMIEKMYNKAGYKMPKILFWNVNGRAAMPYPAKGMEKNVGLVSGFSPNILKTVFETLNLTPVDLMRKKLLSERYKPIKAV